MITLLRMIAMPNIDNLIHRARYEAPCLVKSDLLRLILDMAAALELVRAELDYKSDQNNKLKADLFGSKSESVAANNNAKADANDATNIRDENGEEEAREELKELRAKARKLSKSIKTKKPAPNDKMKNEEISSKVPRGIICPQCNTEVADLGKYREAREIDVHPSRFIDRKVNLHKGSCACGSTTIRMPPPVRASEGSNFSPRFVSRLVLDKFDMSLPVYRQRRMMEYEGLDLNRSTLNRAIARHTNIFGSIAGRIHEINLLEGRLNVDESLLRFIHEGKKKTSFLFCFVSEKAISYKVQDGRNRKIVADLIGSGPGVLQTDGLNIYENEELNKDYAGCLAHMRRYFFQSLISFPEESIEIINLIAGIYEIEHKAREAGLSPSELLDLRKTDSVELLAKIKDTANSYNPPPRSTLGKAVRYMNRHWAKVSYFLKDPNVSPDNNSAERALRLPKLCQKNHLFSQSVSGNNAIENFNTIIATCRLCRVDPEDYLTDITIRINEGHPMSRLDELLPWNWQAAPPCELERARKYVKYNPSIPA